MMPEPFGYTFHFVYTAAAQQAMAAARGAAGKWTGPPPMPDVSLPPGLWLETGDLVKIDEMSECMFFVLSRLCNWLPGNLLNVIYTLDLHAHPIVRRGSDDVVTNIVPLAPRATGSSASTDGGA